MRKIWRKFPHLQTRSESEIPHPTRPTACCCLESDKSYFPELKESAKQTPQTRSESEILHPVRPTACCCLESEKSYLPELTENVISLLRRERMVDIFLVDVSKTDSVCPVQLLSSTQTRNSFNPQRTESRKMLLKGLPDLLR
jgi:hypothetical protein